MKTTYPSHKSPRCLLRDFTAEQRIELVAQKKELEERRSRTPSPLNETTINKHNIGNDINRRQPNVLRPLTSLFSREENRIRPQQECLLRMTSNFCVAGLRDVTVGDKPCPILNCADPATCKPWPLYLHVFFKTGLSDWAFETRKVHTSISQQSNLSVPALPVNVWPANGRMSIARPQSMSFRTGVDSMPSTSSQFSFSLQSDRHTKNKLVASKRPDSE